MNTSDFLDLYEKVVKLNLLNKQMRKEIFTTILKGSSDINYELLSDLLNGLNTSWIKIIEESKRKEKVQTYDIRVAIAIGLFTRSTDLVKDLNNFLKAYKIESLKYEEKNANKK